jgi:two-component system CheB/CheR fusion protein
VAERYQNSEDLTWLARIPERNPDLVLRLTREGRILYMNPSAKAVFGREFDVGSTAPADLTALVGEALSTGMVRQAEIKRAERWLWVAAAADSEEALLFARDITKRVLAVERLRESEERYRTLVELFPDALILHRNQTVIFANRVALSLFRVQSPKELLGLNVLELVHPVDRQAIRERILGAAAGVNTPWREVRMLRRDGEEVLCETSGVGVQYGDELAFQVIIRDITERKAAEEARRASDERFRTIAESLPQLVYELDVNGNPLYFNRRWREYTGQVPGELQNRTELVHPDDRQRVGAAWLQASSTGAPFEAEYRFRRHDGEYRWFLSRAFAVLGPSGQITQWFGTVTDIHELRAAQEALREMKEQLEIRVQERTSELTVAMSALDAERRRFHDVLNLLPAYIILLTEDYRVPLANRYFEDRFGASRGKRCFEYLFKRTTPCEDCQTFKVFDTEAAHHWEWTGPDGRDYDIYDFPFTDVDGSRLVMEMGIDITERKRAEAALRDLNETLEQRVTERTAELQRVNEQLEQADRRKNDFLATLSHELRNPLAPISNSLYVLDRAVPGGEQAKKAKEVVDRQVSHLSRLVNDLLDVTRVSRNKIQLQRERADLCEVVRRSIDDQRSLFERNEVALQVDLPSEPMFAEIDVTRITQVVGNLLQNSAKFTCAGGLTRVSLERGSSTAVLRVTDTGIGMAPATLSNLFQPFMQADRTLHRSSGGLGLGLALVKALVNLHGGDISAHSRGLDQGAEFIVRLPIHPDLVVAERPSAAEISDQPRRILVIEDNVDAAESLRDVLELTGHTVAVAYQGPEGIARARQFRPDVVFCDIGLPGIDGYDVARAIRADTLLSNTFLVALSGYALPEDLERAAAAGFDRHLAKPPSMEEVQELARLSVPHRQKSAPTLE